MTENTPKASGAASGPEDKDSEGSLQRLNDVLARLIGPDGCPWDREQTPASLTEYLVEECFELVDAIRNGTAADVREELGDLMFLAVFVGRLYQDRGEFSLSEALDANAAKMIRRHPHVFGDASINDKKELMETWETIKRQEKADNGEKTPKGIFDSLPRGLPPLTKAYRIHSKAAGAGFTWPDDEEVERQVEAEWLELLDAKEQGDEAAFEHEYGDHLFSLVEFGRRKGLKAAAALDAATNRFLERFTRMESLAHQRGQEFKALTLDEKDELWEEVKKEAPQV